MTRPSLSLNLLTEEVFLLRDAGAVKRSHTCRTIKERNVAEHSHGVAMLIISLYKAAGIRPSGDLLAAALCHDLSEIATGDIPAPVKRYHPELKEELHKITEAWERHMGLLYDLTKDEANLLLWSDRIEFALFSLEEIGRASCRERVSPRV